MKPTVKAIGLRKRAVALQLRDMPHPLIQKTLKWSKKVTETVDLALIGLS